MSDSDHPYRKGRNAWPDATRATRIIEFQTASALRLELIRLRGIVDAGGTPPDRAVVAQTIVDLTEARDTLRAWSRPVRTGLLGVAGTLMSAGVILKLLEVRGALEATTVALVTAVVAIVASEFWAARWLDLVDEYSGLIADLRKVAEKLPPSQSNTTPEAHEEGPPVLHEVPQAEAQKESPHRWNLFRRFLAYMNQPVTVPIEELALYQPRSPSEVQIAELTAQIARLQQEVAMLAARSADTQKAPSLNTSPEVASESVASVTDHQGAARVRVASEIASESVEESRNRSDDQERKRSR